MTAIATKFAGSARKVGHGMIGAMENCRKMRKWRNLMWTELWNNCGAIIALAMFLFAGACLIEVYEIYRGKR